MTVEQYIDDTFQLCETYNDWKNGEYSGCFNEGQFKHSLRLIYYKMFAEKFEAGDIVRAKEYAPAWYFHCKHTSHCRGTFTVPAGTIGRCIQISEHAVLVDWGCHNTGENIYEHVEYYIHPYILERVNDG